MAIEITSNTVVKILVRRGEEEDRTQTLLSNGELGYSQDIGRLFIGDGFTLGGNPVGSVFHGFVPGPGSFDEIAQVGDFIYDTQENSLKARDISTWRSVDLKLSEKSFKSVGGQWYLNDEIFGEDLGFSPLTYEPLAPNQDSLSKDANKIDFNKKYMSLSPQYTSFYFGNWDTKTVKNNFDATVNVADRLYIANTESVPYQIQIHSRTNGVGQLTATQGTFHIKAPDEVGFFTKSGATEQEQLQVWSGNYLQINPRTRFTAGDIAGGQNPNNQIYGYSRFYDDSLFDKNVTVTGNLSVYGDFSYFETVVSVTSALSVINNNPTFLSPMLYVAQRNGVVRQKIAEFTGDPGRPYLVIADGNSTFGPFVGVNTEPSYPSADTANGAPLANFVVSGSVAFGYSNASDRFQVHAGSEGITLNATGGFKSTITDKYTFVASQEHLSTARNFEFNGSDTGNDQMPAVKIKTGLASSAKAGLVINAADNENNIFLVPSVSIAPGQIRRNSLCVERDACIVFGAALPETTRGLVIGPWSDSGGKGIRITNDGSVGVGVSVPARRLDVNGTSQFRDNIKVNTNGITVDAGGITVTAGGITVTAGGITVTAGGANIGGNFSATGTGSFGSTLTVSSNGANITGDVLVTGNLRATQDIVAFHTSDRQLKNNITPITSALEKVNKISGVSFDWNEEKQSTFTGRDIGVVAQEIEEVLPEIVTMRDDGFKAVRYEKIIPLLIEAIKELNKKVR